MDSILQQLNWRYATQQYDPDRKIPEKEIEILKESVRLTPTSYGLQPYKALMVQSPAIRTELRQHSYNQSQVTEASHFMVLVSRTALEPHDVDAYIQLIARTRHQSEESLARFGDHIKQTLAALAPHEQLIWNEKQVYIAVGQLLTTAALLKIDATPMEGFKREGYSKTLELNGYVPVVAVALGYRSESDKHQFYTKVRKSTDELFEIID